MDIDWTVSRCKELLAEDDSLLPALAAIHTLMDVIRHDAIVTMAGLDDYLNRTIKLLRRHVSPSISSGCELFKRFISLTAADYPDFEECKKMLLLRGQQFIANLSQSRRRICDMGVSFIVSDSCILVHGFCHTVLQLLNAAVKLNRHFTVFVAESRADSSGQIMHKRLDEIGVQNQIIFDSAVAYVMERVSFVLFGAESVTENGGIIARIGTFTIALCAKRYNRPVFFAAESVKFSRSYPLCQSELPNRAQAQYLWPTDDANCLSNQPATPTIDAVHPAFDFTPPDCINLLFTDIDVLPPEAVSGELINLYC